MNTIKFNNTEFEVESYTKNTSFAEGIVNSNGYCQLVAPNIANLTALAQNDITSIQIYHNETLIYDLQDINARIDNINEYLNGDKISVNINLLF